MKLVYLTGLVFISSQQPNLYIEIIGIKQIQGSIMVAVYNSPDTFLSQEAAFGDSYEVTADTFTTIIPLAYGKYAVSVFHDLNSDGQLNTNIIGIPKEPVGFSNDARGTFGPPDFENAAFDFSQDQQNHRITINKPGL